MKKFGKFVFTTVSIAAAIGGAVYFVKNVLNKDDNDDFDDFDDFDDDFDDFDLDADEDSAKTDREYVTLNMGDETESDSTEESSETVSADADEKGTTDSSEEE